MTLRDFIQSQYGIRVDIIESTVTVGTTPVRIAQNNPNRISYTLSNLSTNTLYTSGNPSVSNTNGALVSGSQSQVFDWRVDADTTGYDLYGVASAAGTVVYVREVVIIDDEKVAL